MEINTSPVQPALLSLGQAATKLGISEKTAHNWVHLKRFPVKTVKLGDRRMVPARLLDQFIERLIEEYEPEPTVSVPPIIDAKTGKPKRGRGRPRKMAAAEGGAQ